MANFNVVFGNDDFNVTFQGAEKHDPNYGEVFIINPDGNKKTPKIGEVTLLAAAWTGEDNLHSQVVNIDGVTENSQVDLTPNVQQLLIFYEKDLAFVTENENGVVTVYAIGQKPANDYTIQVTITEVDA